MVQGVVGRRIAGLGVVRRGGRPLGCSLPRGGRRRLVGRVGGGGSWGSCIGCMGLGSERGGCLVVVVAVVVGLQRQQQQGLVEYSGRIR